MKKIIILLFIALTTSINLVNAELKITQTGGASITIVDKHEEADREDVFNFLGTYFAKQTPESVKYINLNFKNIPKDSLVETSLKTLVYHDLIKNSNINLKLNRELDAYSFYKLSEKIFDLELELNKNNLKERNVSFSDFNKIKSIVNEKGLNIIEAGDKEKILEKKSILNDVYKTLLKGHYDKDNFNEIDLLDSAIQGAAKGAKDKHTVYFPPVKFKDFNEHLAGEYEGIGSYVDMQTPGEFVITSPIPGGPAERAGLKGGDKVLKVGDKEITKENGLKEIISWIKGPAGTKISLTIQRDSTELIIDVTREKITLKNVESEVFNGNTHYIRLKAFGDNISNEFKIELEKIKEDSRIKRIVIDLRNNGGGYLGEVTKMLGYLVEKGESTALVKYEGRNKNYYSKSENIIDLNNYTVVILQNSGTASASEIMIGTLNDYFENIITLGEKSYGKGSVQTLKQYRDGSSLKYTVAKWFTGKTNTGIDGVGITPDVELELDIEKYQKYSTDNQLEKALYIR